MKPEDKLQIEKFLFLLINSFFVILGVSLFGASLWILFDTHTVITIVNDETDVNVVAGGLFVIGLVIVGVSILGCTGICLENRCLIAFYMGLLIAIIFGEMFTTFLLLMSRSQLERILTDSVNNFISGYGVNDTQPSWSLLNSVQQSAKCCGRLNYSDWKINKFIQEQHLVFSDVYPCSCFIETCPILQDKSLFGNGTHIYTMGCEEKLRDWVGNNVFVIIGIAFALLIIQIMQFIMGVHVFRNISLKLKAKQPEHLINTMEVNQASSSDPQQSDQEYYQCYVNQQLQDAGNQHHDTRSYYQYQEPQYLPRSQTYEQRWNDEHDNVGQDYNRYERQLYVQPQSPEYNHHIYNQRHEDGYNRQNTDVYYDQYQEQNH